MGFSTSTIISDLFQDIKTSLNCAYNSRKDGPIDRFLPILFESRLDDLSAKLKLLSFSASKIDLLKRELLKKYDSKNDKLELDEQLFDELQVYVNYFIVESRSVLDIIEKINQLIYPKYNLPDSFNQLQKHKNFNAESFGSTYYKALLKAGKSRWINELMTTNRSKKTAIRDTRTHYSHLYINPVRVDDKFLFLVRAAKGANPIYSKNETVCELSELVADITSGTLALLNTFKRIFTARYFSQLLLERGYTSVSTKTTG